MLHRIIDSMPGHTARRGLAAVQCCAWNINITTAVAHATRSGTRGINSVTLPALTRFSPGSRATGARVASTASASTVAVLALKDSRFFVSSSHRLGISFNSKKAVPLSLCRSFVSSRARVPVCSENLVRGDTFFHSQGHRHSSSRIYTHWGATATNVFHGQQQVRGMASKNNNNMIYRTSLQKLPTAFRIDSSNKLIYPIVAINVAVFAVWQYAEQNARQFKDPRLFYFMFRNFTDTAQNLREHRVWTLLTSAFSHKEWYHIILNTMVLLSFGDPVWRMLGTRKFLAVYLGSAIASSLSSIAYYERLEPYLRKMQHKPASQTAHYSLGASGAIMGITTAYACVYPLSQYSLFFVINMPAAALIGLFGVYELYNVLAVNTGRFDSAGHLGGGLFGAGYYLVKLRPLIRRMGRR